MLPVQQQFRVRPRLVSDRTNRAGPPRSTRVARPGDPLTPGPRRRRVRPSSGHSRGYGRWTTTARSAPHSHATALREPVVGTPEDGRLWGVAGGLSSTASAEPSPAEARPNDLELTCAPQDADPGLRGASRAGPGPVAFRVRFSSELWLRGPHVAPRGAPLGSTRRCASGGWPMDRATEPSGLRSTRGLDVPTELSQRPPRTLPRPSRGWWGGFSCVVSEATALIPWSRSSVGIAAQHNSSLYHSRLAPLGRVVRH